MNDTTTGPPVSATAVLFTMDTLADAFEQSGARLWTSADVAAAIRKAAENLDPQHEIPR